MRYQHLFPLPLLCLLASTVVAADETFDSNGVKIRYVTEGKGEAVVLIHGWMGDSSSWGRDLSGNTKLKGVEGFQVIALDCRGHGKSDKPHEPEKYGPEMAADVVRLLDHLKIKKAHIIGYSMGVFVASLVVANHPDRVHSVIYGGQAPLIAKEGIKPVDADEVAVFAKAVEEGKGLGSYIIAVTPAGRPKPTEEQANAYANFLFGKKDVKAFAAAGLGFKNMRVKEEQLKACKAPILFIHGANEVKETKDRVENWIKVLGRGEQTVIEGADHVATPANPEFAAAIKRFLLANRSKE